MKRIILLLLLSSALLQAVTGRVLSIQTLTGFGDLHRYDVVDYGVSNHKLLWKGLTAHPRHDSSGTRFAAVIHPKDSVQAILVGAVDGSWFDTIRDPKITYLQYDFNNLIEWPNGEWVYFMAESGTVLRRVNVTTKVHEFRYSNSHDYDW